MIFDTDDIQNGPVRDLLSTAFLCGDVFDEGFLCEAVFNLGRSWANSIESVNMLFSECERFFAHASAAGLWRLIESYKDILKDHIPYSLYDASTKAIAETIRKHVSTLIHYNKDLLMADNKYKRYIMALSENGINDIIDLVSHQAWTNIYLRTDVDQGLILYELINAAVPISDEQIFFKLLSSIDLWEISSYSLMEKTLPLIPLGVVLLSIQHCKHLIPRFFDMLNIRMNTVQIRLYNQAFKYNTPELDCKLDECKKYDLDNLYDLIRTDLDRVIYRQQLWYYTEQYSVMQMELCRFYDSKNDIDEVKNTLLPFYSKTHMPARFFWWKENENHIASLLGLDQIPDYFEANIINHWLQRDVWSMLPKESFDEYDMSDLSGDDIEWYINTVFADLKAAKDLDLAEIDHDALDDKEKKRTNIWHAIYLTMRLFMKLIFSISGKIINPDECFNKKDVLMKICFLAEFIPKLALNTQMDMSEVPLDPELETVNNTLIDLLEPASYLNLIIDNSLFDLSHSGLVFPQIHTFGVYDTIYSTIISLLNISSGVTTALIDSTDRLFNPVVSAKEAYTLIYIMDFYINNTPDLDSPKASFPVPPNMTLETFAGVRLFMGDKDRSVSEILKEYSKKVFDLTVKRIFE